MVSGVAEDGELPGQAAKLHLWHPHLREGRLAGMLWLSLDCDPMSWSKWLGLCDKSVFCVCRGRRESKLSAVSLQSSLDPPPHPTSGLQSSSVIGEWLLLSRGSKDC